MIDYKVEAKQINVGLCVCYSDGSEMCNSHAAIVALCRRVAEEQLEDAAQVAENNGGGHYMAQSCASAIRKYAAIRSRKQEGR